jgi:hypothetical protein
MKIFVDGICYGDILVIDGIIYAVEFQDLLPYEWIKSFIDQETFHPYEDYVLDYVNGSDEDKWRILHEKVSEDYLVEIMADIDKKKSYQLLSKRINKKKDKCIFSRKRYRDEDNEDCYNEDCYNEDCYMDDMTQSKKRKVMKDIS